MRALYRILCAAVLTGLFATTAHAVPTGYGTERARKRTTAERDALTANEADVIYNSDTKHLEFHNGTVWRGLPSTSFKNYTFAARTASSGVYYIGGYYDCPAAAATLTQAGPTITLGSANNPYAAHSLVVAGGAGSASGGTGAVTLVVSGTSINDGGTRTGGDSETIVSDITAASLNEMFEGKKWLGQITFTLTCSGGCTHTAYDFDFNYCLAKYEDWGNRDFKVTDLECTGLANANDSGFDVALMQHKATGWTYSVGAFTAGAPALYSMNATHGAEQDLVSGEQFAFKRSGLADVVVGSGSEGVLIRVATGANNSVSYMNCHIGVEL
jgi:hypothetical protein